MMLQAHFFVRKPSVQDTKIVAFGRCFYGALFFTRTSLLNEVPISPMWNKKKGIGTIVLNINISTIIDLVIYHKIYEDWITLA